METLLTIRVETKDWTEGNHAWFDAKLKANSIIEIECTRINPKSLEWLQKTVERNGGQIQEEWLESLFLSSGCFGEEI